MEENIKIIENAIKEIENNKDMGFFENEEDLKFYNAVKHLIKEYKDLKESGITKSELRKRIDEDAFEVHTREWGNLVVIAVNSIEDLLEGENK